MNPMTRMMKRYIKTPLKYALPLLFIGALVLSVSISGCSKSADYVALNVNSMTTSSQLGSYPLGSTASPGNTYVIFDVTLTNQNKNGLYMGNPNEFTLKTSDGTAYQYSPSWSRLENYLTGVSNTNPGDKVTGTIAFEIPQSATPTQLTYGDQINGVVTANLSGLSGASGASASATPTATLTATLTPTPGSAGHVTVSALPGRNCPYCHSDIENLRAQGYAVTVLYPGDPGFVNNATSYPVIQYG